MHFGYNPLQDDIEHCIDSNLIHYNESFVMGSHGSLPRHHQNAADFIAAGAVLAKECVSAAFPRECTADDLAFRESHRGLKTIVTPHGEEATWRTA